MQTNTHCTLASERHVLSKLLRGTQIKGTVFAFFKAFDLARVKLNTIKDSTEDDTGSSYGVGSGVVTCPLPNSSLSFAHVLK